MYKSQLQEYAQKAGLMHPTYDHVKEGASHEPRFKSTVWVNNQSYESAPGFPTLRSAEHAAAKVALDFLQKLQIPGLAPSPVHESGLCKNLLQEFAQKNGYPLPQYKIMRQGEEHSLVFTATVEIAGVCYSGGGAKSKKEAEIKAARTALLAIQASQPAVGLPAVEPRPLVQVQSQPGQIANFVKSHAKRKKRGRVNPPLIEEPIATRMKQCLGQVGGAVQLPQMHQMHKMHQMPQVSQVSQIPHILHGPPMNQLSQAFPLNSIGYSGQSVMPVEWNHELGVCSRPAVVFSEPMQVGSFVPQDTAMTEPEWGTRPVALQETEPTLDTKVDQADHLTADLGNPETAVFEAQVTTEKAESGIVQPPPLATDFTKDSQISNIIPKGQTNSASEEHTESLATTGLKETVMVTEVHVPPIPKGQTNSASEEHTESLATTGLKETVMVTEVHVPPIPKGQTNSASEEHTESLATTGLKETVMVTEVHVPPIPKGQTNSASEEHTESLATTGLKETVIVTEVHVPPVSTSEGPSVQPQVLASVTEELNASEVDQVSVPITEPTTKTPASDAPPDSVGAQELLPLANGELQAEILRAMTVEIKSVSSEAA